MLFFQTIRPTHPPDCLRDLQRTLRADADDPARPAAALLVRAGIVKSDLVPLLRAAHGDADITTAALKVGAFLTLPPADDSAAPLPQAEAAAASADAFVAPGALAPVVAFAAAPIARHPRLTDADALALQLALTLLRNLLAAPAALAAAIGRGGGGGGAAARAAALRARVVGALSDAGALELLSALAAHAGTQPIKVDAPLILDAVDAALAGLGGSELACALAAAAKAKDTENAAPGAAAETAPPQPSCREKQMLDAERVAARRHLLASGPARRPRFGGVFVRAPAPGAPPGAAPAVMSSLPVARRGPPRAFGAGGRARLTSAPTAAVGAGAPPGAAAAAALDTRTLTALASFAASLLDGGGWAGLAAGLGRDLAPGVLVSTLARSDFTRFFRVGATLTELARERASATASARSAAKAAGVERAALPPRPSFGGAAATLGWDALALARSVWAGETDVGSNATDKAWDMQAASLRFLTQLLLALDAAAGGLTTEADAGASARLARRLLHADGDARATLLALLSGGVRRFNARHQTRDDAHALAIAIHATLGLAARVAAADAGAADAARAARAEADAAAAAAQAAAVTGASPPVVAAVAAPSPAPRAAQSPGDARATPAPPDAAATPGAPAATPPRSAAPSPASAPPRGVTVAVAAGVATVTPLAASTPLAAATPAARGAPSPPPPVDPSSPARDRSAAPDRSMAPASPAASAASPAKGATAAAAAAVADDAAAPPRAAPQPSAAAADAVARLASAFKAELASAPVVHWYVWLLAGAASNPPPVNAALASFISRVSLPAPRGIGLPALLFQVRALVAMRDVLADPAFGAGVACPARAALGSAVRSAWRAWAARLDPPRGVPTLPPSPGDDDDAVDARQAASADGACASLLAVEALWWKSAAGADAVASQYGWRDAYARSAAAARAATATAPPTDNLPDEADGDIDDAGASLLAALAEAAAQATPGVAPATDAAFLDRAAASLGVSAGVVRRQLRVRGLGHAVKPPRAPKGPPPLTEGEEATLASAFHDHAGKGACLDLVAAALGGEEAGWTPARTAKELRARGLRRGRMTAAHDAEVAAVWARAVGDGPPPRGAAETVAVQLAGGWRLGQVKRALKRLGLVATRPRGGGAVRRAAAGSDDDDRATSSDDCDDAPAAAPPPPAADADSPGAREEARRAALDALRAKRAAAAMVGDENAPPPADVPLPAAAATTAPAPKKRRLKRIGAMAAPVRAAFDSDSE